MTTLVQSKLKSLYANLAPGTPVVSKELVRLGISADLAVHYVRAGWLVRLARGVFRRPEQELSLFPSLKLLENQIEGMHVGGKSALDWHGVRHYVTQQEMLHLYGWATARLPGWFMKEFPAEYHRKRLFEEQPGALLQVLPFEGRNETPQVSTPERALLELLSEVGVRQPLQEARELMESTYNLRGGVLQELLMRCTSIKTVRLCLQLGRELSLPWVAKLASAELPTGSNQPWVSRGSHGVLVLKP
ncbi:type IV toxin-antitoxin system AbiEi family antitoxin domain-containing protein [Desulfobulbus alkaliphilus]|uniref:type IV toxin-antitoxin system AbiEi family antitoxin domain-containing protein n=1 Tax=Desulfobulbus alkaliphilus TaxID=869814 RepID=UPI003531DA87